MDVKCACGEPWDADYLRHELINRQAGERWRDQKVKDRLAEEGWRFRGSAIAVVRCPACKGKHPSKEHRDRAVKIAALAELLDGDEDGLASELENLP
jgi:hypothetical protein